LGDERKVIVPRPGRSFVGGDLSTIEPRILAWLSDDAGLKFACRPGNDLYSDALRRIYGQSRPDLRPVAKVGVIGIGYGMGLAKFQETLQCSESPVPEDAAAHFFHAFASAHPEYVGFRSRLYSEMLHALRAGSASCGRIHIQYFAAQSCLVVRLPTDRSLVYRQFLQTEGGVWYAPRAWYVPGIPQKAVPETEDFGDGVRRKLMRDTVLVQNVVQAIARDILAHQCLELERMGLRVAFTRHDEIVAETRACTCSSLGGAHGPLCPWIGATTLLRMTMSKVPDSLPQLGGLHIACKVNDEIRSSYA
jgi:DNA polymerase